MSVKWKGVVHGTASLRRDEVRASCPAPSYTRDLQLCKCNVVSFGAERTSGMIAQVAGTTKVHFPRLVRANPDQIKSCDLPSRFRPVESAVWPHVGPPPDREQRAASEC